MRATGDCGPTTRGDDSETSCCSRGDYVLSQNKDNNNNRQRVNANAIVSYTVQQAASIKVNQKGLNLKSAKTKESREIE